MDQMIQKINIYFIMLHTKSIYTIPQAVLVTVSRFNLKCNLEYIDTALTWRSSTCQAPLSAWVGSQYLNIKVLPGSLGQQLAAESPLLFMSARA